MEYLFVLLLLGISVLAFLSREKGGFKKPEISPASNLDLRAFEAAPSLWVNTAEAAMFAALCRHMPLGFHVHGKVRLEDIIRVKRSLPEKARWAARGRVKSRHVDYLITNRTGRPVLGVELDGRAHNARNPSESDKVKTALFNAAGVPLRRIRVGENFDNIAATIGSELNAS